MEEAIEDEDVMVVYVEDDPTKHDTEAAAIKEELPEASESVPVEEILETAVKHGEFINVLKIERENYEEYEYLEDVEMLDAQNTDSDDKTITRKMRRPKINLKDHVPFSYVQKLRDENPEFARNPSKLINHLAELMAKLRPPPPPEDYYTVKVITGKDTIRSYECNTCGVECESLGACARHYQYYHGESYLKCYACGLGFTNTPHLYKHEKKCKSGDAEVVLKARGRYLGVKGRGRPYTTDNKFLLFQEYSKNKEKRKRVYCSWCPASFAQRVNLEAHELMHKGLRPYRCPLCPAAYTSDYALKRHLQTHDDYRYICDHCGYACKVKSLLVGHMNVHLPRRKYGCGYCGRRFSQKPALTHHVNKLHLHLPPAHACPVCAKGYARMSQVKNHMKKMHGLDMITRVMFLQALPRLDPKLVTDAKVVLKNEEPALPPPATNVTTVPKTPPTPRVPKKNTPKTAKNNVKTKTEENGENKTQHVYIPRSNDPREIEEFLNYLHTEVKPGCKVIKYQDNTKSVRCFRSTPVATLPKVKMVYNYSA